MREIKFRGKRVDSGEWVYGNYHNKHIIYNGDFIYILPETVGQYTGLSDKNEVEIYEGDIIQLKNTKYEIYWFDNGDYRLSSFDCRNEYDKSKSICFSRVGEIIGNITENPNLLQKETNE